MQLIIRRRSKIIQRYGGIQHRKLAARDFKNIAQGTAGVLALENRLGSRVLEALDHAQSVS